MTLAKFRPGYCRPTARPIAHNKTRMQRFSATGHSEQGSTAYSTMHIRIESLRARAVRVPMAPPHQTASGTVTESPLVLIDVVTDQNVVGHSIVFTYTTAVLKPTAELVQNLAPLIEREALAPAAIEQKLARRFRLLGTQGLVGMALAGIDMALWDALARVHNISLVSLLGGSARPVPAYGAVGYDGETESAKVAEDWGVEGSPGLRRRSDTPPLLRISLSSARFAARSDEMPRLWWTITKPSPQPRRSSGCGRSKRKASPGLRSRPWRTITEAMHTLPTKFAPRFSAAKIGGVCAT